MKDLLKKIGKGVAIFLVVLISLVAIGEATGYVKGITRNTSRIDGWTFLTGSHTFLAAQDTAYFLFTPNQLGDGATDTTVARAKVILRGIGTGNIDSITTFTEIWSTSDTTGWWGGATRSKDYRGMWKKYAVGVDSGVTGKERTIGIGNSYGGRLPYMMVVVAGKATVSGGVANKVGNSVQVDIFEE